MKKVLKTSLDSQYLSPVLLLPYRTDGVRMLTVTALYLVPWRDPVSLHTQRRQAASARQLRIDRCSRYPLEQ